jgi:hypothetical protein
MDEFDDVDQQTDAADRRLQRTIIQVAAVLIAVAVVLKLWQMRSQRADDAAFARLESEVDNMPVSPTGRHALHSVIDYAQELTRQARHAAT